MAVPSHLCCLFWHLLRSNVHFWSAIVLRNLVKWAVWVLRNLTSSCRFLESTSRRDVLRLSIASSLPLSSITFSVCFFFLFSSSLMRFSMSALPCSACSYLRIANVMELQRKVISVRLWVVIKQVSKLTFGKVSGRRRWSSWFRLWCARELGLSRVDWDRLGG